MLLKVNALSFIGRSEPRAASLPGRTEEMKMQDGCECIVYRIQYKIV
jgi:hypothetical protein